MLPFERRHATWMTAHDERLLELLGERGEATAALIASDPRVPPTSTGRVRERLWMLAQAELVTPDDEDLNLTADPQGPEETDRRWWGLTIWGRRYLDGDLDVGHRPRPRAARSPSRGAVF